MLAACVGAQVQLLRALLAAIADPDRALRTALGIHPKTAVLVGMPRIGQINLARSWLKSAPSWTGPATPNTPPPRPAPAGHQTVRQGHLGPLPLGGQHPRPRRLATFADNSRHASPWAAALYRQARRRGKPHPQAVRILMRAWLRVMWACWHTNTPYQVNHHRAERRLTDQAAAQG